MSIKGLFKKLASKKAVGIGIAAGGGALLVVDAFRLAHGDGSVITGASLAHAFMSYAGLIGTGVSMIPKEEKEEKTIVVQGFNRSSNPETTKENQPKIIFMDSADQYAATYNMAA